MSHATSAGILLASKGYTIHHPQGTHQKTRQKPSELDKQ